MRADLDTLVTALYVTIDDLFGPDEDQAAHPSFPTVSWGLTCGFLVGPAGLEPATGGL